MCAGADILEQLSSRQRQIHSVAVLAHASADVATPLLLSATLKVSIPTVYVPCCNAAIACYIIRSHPKLIMNVDKVQKQVEIMGHATQVGASICCMALPASLLRGTSVCCIFTPGFSNPYHVSLQSMPEHWIQDLSVLGCFWDRGSHHNAQWRDFSFLLFFSFET